MRSSLDSIEGRDNVYDESFLVKPTRKTDSLTSGNLLLLNLSCTVDHTLLLRRVAADR